MPHNLFLFQSTLPHRARLSRTGWWHCWWILRRCKTKGSGPEGWIGPLPGWPESEGVQNYGPGSHTLFSKNRIRGGPSGDRAWSRYFTGRFFGRARRDRPVSWHLEIVFGVPACQTRQNARKPKKSPMLSPLKVQIRWRYGTENLKSNV